MGRVPTRKKSKNERKKRFKSANFSSQKMKKPGVRGRNVFVWIGKKEGQLIPRRSTRKQQQRGVREEGQGQNGPRIQKGEVVARRWLRGKKKGT